MPRQSQRYTVKPVGKRSVGRPRCLLCGSIREMLPGSGVCQHGCFWNLPGWVGFNAVSGKVVFTDHRALALAKLHRHDPKTGKRSAKSFPKIVALATSLGWDGDTNAPSQPTFTYKEEF